MNVAKTIGLWLLFVSSPFLAEAASARQQLPEFKAHLADPAPCTKAESGLMRHYAPYTRKLKSKDDRVRLLFNSVVSKMVAAELPSEYALIPFIESHYTPSARSALGPAGLWQFTAGTARHHGLRVGGPQDERLNAVRSTEAAIKYLRYLHRKFKGHEQTVLMAFNAGEGRILASRGEKGRGLSGITRVYPDKITAISCNILRQDG